MIGEHCCCKDLHGGELGLGHGQDASDDVCRFSCGFEEKHTATGTADDVVNGVFADKADGFMGLGGFGWCFGHAAGVCRLCARIVPGGLAFVSRIQPL